MFVGWDWGNTAHDVTVIDSAGDRVHRMAIPHTEDGIVRAVAKLADHGDPGELPVAIETTRGLVVDRLLAAGHPVIPVHPNAFHAVRPRWGAARAKNDPGDSFKLADYARTDIHRLPVLVPTLPETLELQALTRQRDNQLALRIAAVNQLAALLDQHWPGGKTIFAQLHSPIALDFLHRYPTPQAAATLTRARIEAFCRRRQYSGRRTGAELLDRLRHAPIAARRADCGADDPYPGLSRACPPGRHRHARHRDRKEGHRTPLRGPAGRTATHRHPQPGPDHR